MSLIVSWNVNSIRSRLNHLLDLIRDKSPEVILLQEIKCERHNFPYMEIEDLGYNIAILGQKSYNGVAILSKSRIEDVFTDITSSTNDEARYIEASVCVNNAMLKVASVYVPQGTELNSDRFDFKLQYFDFLKNRFKALLEQDEIMFMGGDYNVAPEPCDVWDAKYLNGKLGFHIEERKKWQEMTSIGMFDSFRVNNPNEIEFSWWDYRSRGFEQNRGMRIDQILVSANACEIIKESNILKHYRAKEKASDHVPIYCKI